MSTRNLTFMTATLDRPCDFFLVPRATSLDAAHLVGSELLVATEEPPHVIPVYVVDPALLPKEAKVRGVRLPIGTRLAQTTWDLTVGFSQWHARTPNGMVFAFEPDHLGRPDVLLANSGGTLSVRTLGNRTPLIVAAEQFEAARVAGELIPIDLSTATVYASKPMRAVIGDYCDGVSFGRLNIQRETDVLVEGADGTRAETVTERRSAHSITLPADARGLRKTIPGAGADTFIFVVAGGDTLGFIRTKNSDSAPPQYLALHLRAIVEAVKAIGG